MLHASRGYNLRDHASNQNYDMIELKESYFKDFTNNIGGMHNAKGTIYFKYGTENVKVITEQKDIDKIMDTLNVNYWFIPV